jgi:hypothetical protein
MRLIELTARGLKDKPRSFARRMISAKEEIALNSDRRDLLRDGVRAISAETRRAMLSGVNLAYRLNFHDHLIAFRSRILGRTEFRAARAAPTSFAVPVFFCF